MVVYEPREDSFLLKKAVKQFAFGRVLDMGTGSGIQAIAAAKNPTVTEVVAVDINPEALIQAKENAGNLKISFKQSNLFEKVEGKFDTIIFNPPYLPSSKEYEDDIALESGESGREATERFLLEFEGHLNEKGMVLLLQSSASDWEKTKRDLEAGGWVVEVVEREKFFFEEIVVLKIKK